MSLSSHIENKNENVLILGEVATQKLDDRTLTAEAKYPFAVIWGRMLEVVILVMSWNTQIRQKM